MVELAASDVLTKEVLQWQGLHLFHFIGSSCSQKLRIYAGLKNIDLTLHHINLVKRENQTDWYMGINPRGLVPTLIDDGKVIIESNDIITYLEKKFPAPELIPLIVRMRWVICCILKTSCTLICALLPRGFLYQLACCSAVTNNYSNMKMPVPVK